MFVAVVQARLMISLIVGSLAAARVRTHAASCSIPIGFIGLPASSRRSRERPATHMNAPSSPSPCSAQYSAFVTPPFGMAWASARPVRSSAGGGDGRFEWRPAGGRQAGDAAGVEHGDVAFGGARGDGGVVQVALDRHGDDGAVPGGDRRRGECGLARSGRSDQRDRSTVALPLAARPASGWRWRSSVGEQRTGRASGRAASAPAVAPPVDDEWGDVASSPRAASVGRSGCGVAPEPIAATPTTTHSEHAATSTKATMVHAQ